MRFWIQCTNFETGQPVHINIALVGSMLRNGERTVLIYVGDGQTIEVTETPEQILERHFGPMGKARRPVKVTPSLRAKRSNPFYPRAAARIASSLRSSQ